MKTLIVSLAAVLAVAACASETPVPAAAPSGVQPTCKHDSECPRPQQCERGHCLTPNDIGPQAPSD